VNRGLPQVILGAGIKTVAIHKLTLGDVWHGTTMLGKNETIKRKITERWRVFFLFLAIAILWALTSQLPNLGWIAKRDYSIFGAPLLEEAFKGVIVYPILVALYLRFNKTSWRKLGLLVGPISGLIAGFIFGILEGVLQGESIQNILSAVVTHSFWAAAVGIGISSYLLAGKKGHLIGIYFMVVFAHGIWNYNTYHPSALAHLIATALVLLVIPIALLTYPKIHKGGSPCFGDVMGFTNYLII